ncbi:hypothetical protein STEG23_018727, partial [Scotinomys teguina]
TSGVAMVPRQTLPLLVKNICTSKCWSPENCGQEARTGTGADAFVYSSTRTPPQPSGPSI